MFYPGQKVVCVDSGARGDRDPFLPGEAIVEGQVYTVLRSYIWNDPLAGFQPCKCCWLFEVRRCEGAVDTFGPDVGYGQDRFRPLVSRPTDISIFTSLLDGPKKVTERVLQE